VPAGSAGSAGFGVVQDITGLQHLDDNPAGLSGSFGLEDRLMQIVVKTLTVRIDAPEAVPLEYRKQLALGRLDTSDEAARALVLDLGLGQTVERSAQVVGHRKQLLRKAGNRILQRVLAFALGAASDIFGLGQRSQQLILVLGELRLERRDTFFGRRLGRRGHDRRPALLGDVVVRRLLEARHRLPFLAGIVHQSSYPMSRPITLAV